MMYNKFKKNLITRFGHTLYHVPMFDVSSWVFSLWFHGLVSNGVELQTTDEGIPLCRAQGKINYQSV